MREGRLAGAAAVAVKGRKTVSRMEAAAILALQRRQGGQEQSPVPSVSSLSVCADTHHLLSRHPSSSAGLSLRP
ncbi:hypothetical protein PR202_ga14357 [Eleusine coracana subsp. coracana]|uniref:Uncharacterized protein n=1 Tax=Eleusine coracana subsp. coracana TaxID=191504 RepID=A0AAV5CH35_ELECO|nr:hypothetical protein PR202_ga14357 [Eleusine coracana subsp. coracana]